MHELQDFNVLQLSVHDDVSDPVSDRTLRRGRVLRIDLVRSVPRLPTVPHGEVVSASTTDGIFHLP